MTRYHCHNKKPAADQIAVLAVRHMALPHIIEQVPEGLAISARVVGMLSVKDASWSFGAGCQPARTPIDKVATVHYLHLQVLVACTSTHACSVIFALYIYNRSHDPRESSIGSVAPAKAWKYLLLAVRVSTVVVHLHDHRRSGGAQSSST